MPPQRRRRSSGHFVTQARPEETPRKRLFRLVTAVAILLVLYAISRWIVGPDEVDDRRVAVSGTVKYQGEPVQVGTISFAPTKGENGLAAGGRIEAGEYSLSADTGPSMGSHTVQIMIGKFERNSKERNPSFRIDKQTVSRDARLNFNLPPD